MTPLVIALVSYATVSALVLASWASWAFYRYRGIPRWHIISRVSISVELDDTG